MGCGLEGRGREMFGGEVAMCGRRRACAGLLLLLCGCCCYVESECVPVAGKGCRIGGWARKRSATVSPFTVIRAMGNDLTVPGRLQALRPNLMGLCKGSELVTDLLRSRQSAVCDDETGALIFTTYGDTSGKFHEG